MNKHFKSLISDERGSISSKRIVGILCALTLIMAMIYNTFAKNITPPAEFLVQYVALLCFGCLGLTTVDKFSLKKNQEIESQKGT